MVLRDGPSKVGKLLHEGIVFGQALLEVALRMHVNDDNQAVVKDYLYGRIQIAEIFRRKLLRLVHREHRLRVDAQAHVVEAHRLDQRNVVSRGPCFKVFTRVAALVPDLSEPLAEVDSATQVLSAGEGWRGAGTRCALPDNARCHRQKSKKQNNSTM